MKLAFIIHYFGHYKPLGPIVAEALDQGWQVSCWHNYTLSRTGGKAYLFPQVEQVPQFDSHHVDYRTFASGDEFRALVTDPTLDVVIQVIPKAYLSRLCSFESVPISCKFVLVQSGLDTFLHERHQSNLASSDLICLYSRFWLDWGTEYFAAQGKDIARQFHQRFIPKATITGFPELDVVADIDAEQVRKRWSIPQGQPVVLLLPITLANQQGAWPRIFAGTNRLSQLGRMVLYRGFEHWPLVRHGWNDLALTTAIRRFCDRNDAFLLVKGRRKDPVRPHLAAVADKVIYDQSDYPATVLEAISIADLCIHFYSTAVFETAKIGCYSLCVDRPSFNRDNKVQLSTRMWRHGQVGHAYNYKGVSDWWTIPQAISDLPQKSLSDFEIDPLARSTYIEKFLGYDDGQSSKRVLDAVEALITDASSKC